MLNVIVEHFGMVSAVSVLYYIGTVWYAPL